MILSATAAVAEFPRPMISMRDSMIDFVKSGWRTSELARFYQAPKKIYATCLIIPPVLSSIAPSAFGDKDASGALWMVHYKGKISHRDGITFRFWCTADETVTCTRRR
jgi:hypothetical protein